MENLFFNVPTGWDQISFAHFQKICKMNTFEDQFRSITGRDWRTVPLEQMHLYNWIREIPDFENTIPELSFIYNNETYHFLGGVTSNDVGQIPLGVIGDCNSERGRQDHTFLIAALYWKQDEVYDNVIKEIDKRAKMFQNLPMTIVFGINSFFLFLSQNSAKVIQNASVQIH